MKYCNNCQQKVKPVKTFNFGWFLFWMVFTLPISGVIGMIGYIIFYSFKPKHCPICKSDVFAPTYKDKL